MYSVKGVPVHLHCWQNKKSHRLLIEVICCRPIYISHQMSPKKTSCNKILPRQLSKVYEMAQDSDWSTGIVAFTFPPGVWYSDNSERLIPKILHQVKLEKLQFVWEIQY